MKKKILSMALVLALLLSLTTVFTPISSVAAPFDNPGGWDFVWNGGSATISWPAVPGATSYTIAHNGTRVGTFAAKTTVSGLEYTDVSPNANKYENYYKVTPVGAAGAEPYLISLENKLFGLNTYFYDAKYCTGFQAAEEVMNIGWSAAAGYTARGQTYGVLGMNWSEFSTRRFGLFFKPGDYSEDHAGIWMPIGFNTSAYGLGRLPTDTVLATIWTPPSIGGGWGGNSTQVFWRSIENIKTTYSLTNPRSPGDGFNWAVSQAAPARRIDIDSNCWTDWTGTGAGCSAVISSLQTPPFPSVSLMPRK